MATMKFGKQLRKHWTLLDQFEAVCRLQNETVKTCFYVKPHLESENVASVVWFRFCQLKYQNSLASSFFTVPLSEQQLVKARMQLKFIQASEVVKCSLAKNRKRTNQLGKGVGCPINSKSTLRSIIEVKLTQVAFVSMTFSSLLFRH